MPDDAYTRAQLLAMVPAQYLRGGYFAGPDDAEPRPELGGTWALAAAERLNQGQVPGELLDQALGELRAFRSALAGPLAPLLPRLRALGARPDYKPHPALAELLQACLAAVGTVQDLDACLVHLDKVNALAALNRTLYKINAKLRAGSGADDG